MSFSPELLDALADGLLAWASILPQTETDRYGRHKPANSWGLDPEFSKLCLIQASLELRGAASLAAQVCSIANRLFEAAVCLDKCYPKVSADEDADERRLVKTCRGFAQSLAHVLRELKRPLFGVAGPSPQQRPVSSPPPTRESVPHSRQAPRKRASRATAIESLERALIEHIKAAKEYGLSQQAMNRPAKLLPPPTQAQLAMHAGLAPHVVCRCLRDPAAHQLRLLWKKAADLDWILRH